MPKPKRAPTKPRKPKTVDPAQYERFRQFAKEHEADAEPEQFDRGFRKIVPPKSS
jgi:hypothetical protein